jgi:phosphatidylethanolamine-binding protein (PEBP) family uncharacterized protein
VTRLRSIRATTALAPLAAVALLALSGCAGSGSAAVTAKVAKIVFKSSAIASATLPSRFTCDGADESPPLEWGEVPAGTRELALLAFGLKPSGGGHFGVSVEWAVAGLNPALHHVPAGKLPSGAHLGSRSDGKSRYSICPAKGESGLYQFTLYAVPASVTIPSEFTGLEVLSEIGAETAPYAAKARGSFEASYTRKA